MTKKTTISREGADGGNATSSRTAPANESQSQHTPGPWRAGIGDDVERAGEFELACIEHHIFGSGIYARGEYYSEDYAEHVANANLIAAAPDLLTALKQAVETIRTWHSIHIADDDAWDIYRQHAPEMKAINAAIAKAEGR